MMMMCVGTELPARMVQPATILDPIHMNVHVLKILLEKTVTFIMVST